MTSDRPGPSLAGFPELPTYVLRTPVGKAVIDPPSLPGRAMQAIASSRILRSAVRVTLLALLVAGAVGLGAWHLLPYEALDAETPAQRFMLWEGALWGLGATGTLWGIASLFNATDLYSPRPLEQVQQQARDALQGRTLYSDLPEVPWVMLACSLALILVAVVGRAVMVG
jgi:hypothetical protein